MPPSQYIVLTHGGAGSDPAFKDGTDRAAQACLNHLKTGTPLIDAVCHAVSLLEGDTRFNAGLGSHPRSDGSVQMDAAVMDDQENFGAVAALEGYANAIHIARAVATTSYKILAGRGAAEFAKSRKFPPLAAGTITATGKDFSTTDTVGCVAYDGQRFAAGLSTGGIQGALPGRVGDVPLIGCGLYAGRQGGVVATGAGEAIAMQMTAYRAYRMVEGNTAPEAVLEEALTWFDSSQAFGLLVVTRSGFAGGANRPMAWSAVEEKGMA